VCSITRHHLPWFPAACIYSSDAINALGTVLVQKQWKSMNLHSHWYFNESDIIIAYYSHIRSVTSISNATLCFFGSASQNFSLVIVLDFTILHCCSFRPDFGSMSPNNYWFTYFIITSYLYYTDKSW
jgi:hypothetical protein